MLKELWLFVGAANSSRPWFALGVWATCSKSDTWWEIAFFEWLIWVVTDFNETCEMLSEKAMAPHSSTLAWKIPWTEEPRRLQSMGSLRVEHDWVTSLHLSLSCIGEGNGNPLQCSCLENPRDGRAWWAAVYGVTQSRTRLKRLSSSSSSSEMLLVAAENIFIVAGLWIELAPSSQCSVDSCCKFISNYWVFHFYVLLTE